MQSYEPMNLSKTIRDREKKRGQPSNLDLDLGTRFLRFNAVAKRDQKIQLQACEHGKNIISSQT